MLSKKQGSLETLIGQDSLIRGELVSKGVVRLDGSVEGSVEADHLILGRSGTVKGEMSAREVIIDGTVEGSINAEEMVEIKPDGVVEGDIRTFKLVIAEGAFFSGHSYMQRAVAAEESGEESPEAAEKDKKVERIF
ncbi:MAG TPA: polymer-forming cytoskeletal protein [Syntrophorhabdaceae bacterium]|nr:polymer-forming cytoskeletal protein [Syntrophorhabdaceae bacterium]